MSKQNPESSSPDELRDPCDRRRAHPFVTRLRGYIDLSNDDLDFLWELIETEQMVKKRTDLIVDGDEYRKLCFVEEGFAARYRLLRNGKCQIVNFILPGDIIGMPGSFLDTAPYSVAALTDMKLQTCSLNDFVGLCYGRPQFGLALSWFAIQEVAIYAEHIVNTGRRTPLERLAHLLLEIYSRLEMAGKASGLSFTLPFSQEVLSDALGLSVPHVNRTLGKLRLEEFINVDGRRVDFLDVKALEKLGQFQALKLTPVPVMQGNIGPRVGALRG